MKFAHPSISKHSRLAWRAGGYGLSSYSWARHRRAGRAERPHIARMGLETRPSPSRARALRAAERAGSCGEAGAGEARRRPRRGRGPAGPGREARRAEG